MDYKLHGKVALVTGSSQGIGKAVAIELARSGADVILCARQLEKLKETAAEIEKLGRKALALKMDISQISEVEEAAELAIREFGHIDILVNSAGIGPASLLIDMEEKLWDDLFNTNLKGPAFLTKAVARHMIDKKLKGRIIYISSQAGKMGEVGNSAYCASKAAINLMTQCAALELAEYGINVVAVCPGIIDTQMMQDAIVERAPMSGMTSAQFEQMMIGKIPLGRMGTPEDIASFVCFLASDDASFITGVALTIAGGQMNI